MRGPGAADRIRGRIGAAIIERIAGRQAASRQRSAEPTRGERWFAEDRPIRQMHSDSAMFIGAIRAQLQSLHPLTMAAVAQHFDYQDDRWGRLQRTCQSIDATTFGKIGDVYQAIARVRAIHQRVTGIAPDGRPHAASGPHLLTWVHIAKADSFLRAHTCFGVPLYMTGRDGYEADMVRIDAELRVLDPPRTAAELADRIRAYRPELAATHEAYEAARSLLLRPAAPYYRPRPVRSAGRGRGPATARMGPATALPAQTAGDRDRGGLPGRARHGARHPLGCHGASPLRQL